MTPGDVLTIVFFVAVVVVAVVVQAVRIPIFRREMRDVARRYGATIEWNTSFAVGNMTVQWARRDWSGIIRTSRSERSHAVFVARLAGFVPAFHVSPRATPIADTWIGRMLLELHWPTTTLPSSAEGQQALVDAGAGDRYVVHSAASGLRSFLTRSLFETLATMSPDTSLSCAGAWLSLHTVQDVASTDRLDAFMGACADVADKLVAASRGSRALPGPDTCYGCGGPLSGTRSVRCPSCETRHHGSCFAEAGCHVWTCPNDKDAGWALRRPGSGT